METAIYLISLIFYIITFCLRKRMGFILYQLFIAVIYLISLSYIQTLDITLILYSFFSGIPFLRYFSIKNTINKIFLLYFIPSIFYSIITNGVTDALSIYTIRLIGVSYYAYLFLRIKEDKRNKEKIKIDPESIDSRIEFKKDKQVLLLFLFGEIVLTVIGVILSGGIGRLMLNYQCTVGNISICGVLLCGSILNSIKKDHNLVKKKRNIITIWIIVTAFTFLSIFSGTRGYIIVCLGMFFIYTIFYLTRFTKIMVSLSLLLAIILIGGSFLDNSIEGLGFKNSTGRRTSENNFVLQYMPNSPIHMIFGYGFGKKVKTLPNHREYVYRVADTRYTNFILPQVNGFHNFYITIYYSSGLAGLTIVLFMLANIIKNLYKLRDKKLAIILVSYVVLYMVLLWFRWTATSGILEFATIKYILMKEKKYEK